MKFSFIILKFIGFTIGLFLLFVYPQKSIASFLNREALSEYDVKAFLKIKFIGEIVGYSYIKLDIESSGDAQRYKNGSIPLKGDMYEAVSGKTFKVIGSYNTKTLQWKLDCFDQNNAHVSVFVGKESREGNVNGKWSNKKAILNFYLKKSN